MTKNSATWPPVLTARHREVTKQPVVGNWLLKALGLGLTINCFLLARNQVLLIPASLKT